MKTAIRLAFLALVMVWAGSPVLQAQQFPISNNYIFKPGMMNPASMGAVPLNNVYLGHQQRSLMTSKWNSISQFLNFNSDPMGRSKNFGWGIFLTNDIEHTENRIALSGAIAARLIENERMRFSVGISGGLINWGSNYRFAKVYDRTDELIARPINFADLDAGVGFEFEYSTPYVRGELNAAGLQLPGSMLSKDLPGLDLRPHVLAGGGVRYAVIPDIYLGPQFFYRNTIFSADTTIKAGVLDAGLKMDFPQRGIWFGGSYRLNDAAVTGAFGIQIIGADTFDVDSRVAYFMDLYASASYPLNEAQLFGPSFEIGVGISFGRVGHTVMKTDTVGKIQGSFWKNDGLVNMHMTRKLRPNGPPGLAAATYVTDSKVAVNYEWGDDSRMYVGMKREVANDTLLSRLGAEWIGVDPMLEKIVTNVIREGLTPDTTGGISPDSLEPLRDLVSLELGARLRVDEMAATFGADGMAYRGELGFDPGSDNMLSMVVQYGYEGQDTVVKVYKDSLISNLELACLKLHAMRKKLEYELNKYYSSDLAFLWEGEELTDDKTLGKKVVRLKTPMVAPNHPNQKELQVTMVTVNFTRFEEHSTLGDIQEAKEAAAGKKRNGKRKNKDKDRDYVE